MKYVDRNGNVTELETGQDRLLKKMYTTVFGRFVLKILTARCVSKICGFFLNRRISVLFINKFIKNNNIDMSQFEERKYKSYNDFFSRKIKTGKRKINDDSNVLVSPCDGKLSIMDIDDNTVFNIKNGQYTMEMLLKNKELAEEFKGGKCLLLRLTVDDYHRYSYPCDGKKEPDVYIKGILHTVNPVAAEHLLIYKENSRVYTVINSEKFGKIIQMEVGALIVGKITNHHKEEYTHSKGEEKGYFEFGGSTVVLFLKKDAIEISPDIVKYAGDDCELLVKMGEELGRAK